MTDGNSEPLDQRPWNDLATTGLLWLINTSILHPRGYALAIHTDNDGNATGWSILGDGTERWAFAEQWPEGHRSPDDAFQAIKHLLP
jgi:hypothetical protein